MPSCGLCCGIKDARQLTFVKATQKTGMVLLANLVSQNLLITVHSKVAFDDMQVFYLDF